MLVQQHYRDDLPKVVSANSLWNGPITRDDLTDGERISHSSKVRYTKETGPIFPPLRTVLFMEAESRFIHVPFCGYGSTRHCREGGNPPFIHVPFCGYGSTSRPTITGGLKTTGT